MNTYAYEDLKAVKVGTPERIVWEIDVNFTTSTRHAGVHEAWALLSPVDCSYTLVFECEGDDAWVPILSDDPHTDEEKARLLAMFAQYDKVTIKNLRAVEPKPEGPYCIYEGEDLSVNVGTNNWLWRRGVIYFKRSLNTADIAALCNPHKCEARVEAHTKDGSLVSYFNLGTLTPEEMLKYDRFCLISIRSKEH